MTSQIVKAQRKKLSACMTCTLCNRLFTDATTISECLHTFCRECIYKKITDEECYSCPICNTDLGCTPLEKLRSDNILQDLRNKIFQCEKKMKKIPEAVPSVSLPAKRKEKSLSSLGFSSPPTLSNYSGLNARRAKSAARKIFTLRESIKSIDEVCRIVEEDDKKDKNFIETGTLSTNAPVRLQVSLDPVPSSQQIPNGVSEENVEPWTEQIDLCKPLNCLVEAAGKLKSRSKIMMHMNAAKPVSESHKNKGQASELKTKEHHIKLNGHSDENDSTLTKSNSKRPRRLQGDRPRRTAVFEGLKVKVPERAWVGPNMDCNRKLTPIWFSLIASSNQEGDAPLPQISKCYLRVRDGNLPVSFIKKYLMLKLGLASEAEVEITVQDQPVIPTLQLCKLVDLWLQTVPNSERIKTSVGSSGKEFVMVLSYGRKVLRP